MLLTMQGAVESAAQREAVGWLTGVRHWAANIVRALASGRANTCSTGFRPTVDAPRCHADFRNPELSQLSENTALAAVSQSTRQSKPSRIGRNSLKTNTRAPRYSTLRWPPRSPVTSHESQVTRRIYSSIVSSSNGNKCQAISNLEFSIRQNSWPDLRTR